MAQPFIGQLLAVPYNFAPQGWALCDGQLLAISQNQALFSLLGTSYGGDGRETFGLPDLRGRVPVSSGQGPGLSPYSLGQAAGAESVNLTAAEPLPDARRHRRGHRRVDRAVPGEHDRVHAEQRRLELGGVRHHSPAERRRGTRDVGERRGDQAARQRLGHGDRMAAGPQPGQDLPRQVVRRLADEPRRGWRFR